MSSNDLMSDRDPRPRRSGLVFTMRHLFAKRQAQAGGFIVLALIFMALFAPQIAPYDPFEINVPGRLQPPNRQHWLGTDDLGRDQLSRIIYGSRITLQVGIVSVGIALVGGSVIGLISAFYGGWVDMIIMRGIDIMLAFPYILLALAIVAVLGPSLTNAMIAIGISNMPGWARLVRGNALSIKENDYCMAANSVGCSDFQIMYRHILPNIVSPMIVLATLQFPAAVLSAAALSFVGLGAQPPSPEWGALLTGARVFIRTAPWLVNFPGVAIFITIIGFNLLGNALRDTLDPQLREG